MSMRLWDLVGIELTFIWRLSDERVQVTRLYLKAAVARCNILQWRHNERDGVSNRRHLDCLLSRLFRRISKKTIKAPRQWPLWGEFTGDRWIPHTKGQWRGKCFHLMTPSCVGVGAVWTNYAVLRQERITRWRMPRSRYLTGLKLENYSFFTFTFSRPEVRKLLLFYVFTFSRPEVRKLLLFYVFTYSRPEVRKLLLFYVFTFSRPEVRKLLLFYVFTFSRPEVRKLFRIYVFTFSRPARPQ